MSLLPTGAPLAALLNQARNARLVALVQRRSNGTKGRPETAELTREGGLVGDRWIENPSPMRQLTVMDVAVIRLLLAERVRVGLGAADLLGHLPLELPGDNLVVDHPTSVTAMPAGSRWRVGSALVEVNDVPHLGCKKFEARFGTAAMQWVNERADLPLRLRGVNATVVEDGEARLGDPWIRVA
ncbi:MAG TPA: hypothetical protein PK095_15040 [Myxococcota bacterium]|nr:hypothetical protein [Myxococcota bacterium]